MPQHRFPSLAAIYTTGPKHGYRIARAGRTGSRGRSPSYGKGARSIGGQVALTEALYRQFPDRQARDRQFRDLSPAQPCPPQDQLPDRSNSEREESIVPAQALYFMNNPWRLDLCA